MEYEQETLFGDETVISPRCSCCGYDLSKELSSGLENAICPICGKKNQIRAVKHNDWDSRLENAIKSRNTYDFAIAKQELDKAITDAKSILQTYENRKNNAFLQIYLANYYFQMALTHYGVSFVKASSLRKNTYHQWEEKYFEFHKTPFVCKPPSLLFSLDEDYLASLSYLKEAKECSSENRAIKELENFILEKGRELNHLLLEESFTCSSPLSTYDIYLSYSAEDTSSATLAKSLYHYLSEVEKYHVYWQESRSNPSSYRALKEAKALIVISPSISFYRGRELDVEIREFCKNSSSTLFFIGEEEDPLHLIKNCTYLSSRNLLDILPVLSHSLRSLFGFDQSLSFSSSPLYQMSLTPLSFSIKEETPLANRKKVISDLSLLKTTFGLYEKETEKKKKKRYLSSIRHTLRGLRKDNEEEVLYYSFSYLALTSPILEGGKCLTLLLRALEKAFESPELYEKRLRFLSCLLKGEILCIDKDLSLKRALNFSEKITLYRFLLKLPNINSVPSSFQNYSSIWEEISAYFFQEVFYGIFLPEKLPSSLLIQNSLKALYPYFSTHYSKKEFVSLLLSFTDRLLSILPSISRGKQKEYKALIEQLFSFLEEGKCDLFPIQDSLLNTKEYLIFEKALLKNGKLVPFSFKNKDEVLSLLKKMFQNGYLLKEDKNYIISSLLAYCNSLLIRKKKTAKVLSFYQNLLESFSLAEDWQSFGKSFQNELLIQLVSTLIALEEWEYAVSFISVLENRYFALTSEEKTKFSYCSYLFKMRKNNYFACLMELRKDREEKRPFADNVVISYHLSLLEKYGVSYKEKDWKTFTKIIQKYSKKFGSIVDINTGLQILKSGKETTYDWIGILKKRLKKQEKE